jgi:hypothetical protein
MVTENPEAYRPIESAPNLAGALQNALPGMQLLDPRDISESVLFFAPNDSGRAVTGSGLAVHAGLMIR